MYTIRNLPVLSGLDDECLSDLEDIATSRTYRRGFPLTVEGQSADWVYVITSGVVGITYLHEDGRELTIEILGPGTIVGEVTLFGSSSRSANVEALDTTTVIAFPSEQFKAVMRRHSNLGLVIAEVLSNRLRSADERIRELALFDARERIKGALRRLAENLGESQPDGSVVLPFRFRHRDLANLTGVSRETATKILGSLMNERTVCLVENRLVFSADWNARLK